MELFEIRPQAFDDLDGIRNGRLIHVDLLEAPHKSAVLLEELAVFFVGGRADATDRPACQGRFEQVRGIERAARSGTGTDHGVNFVDEEHRIGHLLELLHHRLEPLLKVAAIACTGQERTHIERIDDGFLEHFGHVALNDLARQAFGNSRLAHTSITDIERIVLRTTAQHLDGPAQLGVAADQRVDLAGTGLLIEIDAEIGQRRTLLRLRTTF